MGRKLGITFINFIYHNLFIVSLRIHLITCASFRNETDRQALLAFKKLIIEDPRGVMSSWNESLHFCSWHGVTCGRKHQRVVGLDLQNHKLVGKISPSIANLSFLKSIQLQENSLSGTIPQVVTILPRLQYLNLSYNALQGEIPSNFSRFFELRVIDIGHNGLVGKVPESLGSLSNLTYLSFQTNHLHGTIPPSLCNLSLIEYLTLSGNHLQGTIPDSIGRLKNLIEFGIGENNISGTVPPSLYNISSLAELYFIENQLTGRLPSDIGLTLPNIQTVSIGENHWSGPLPVSFSNASKMKIFDLVQSNLEGPIPADLARRMVDLHDMRFGFNNFGTGDGRGLSFLDSLSNCTKLQTLGISANNFGGAIPSVIGNLSTQLKFLYLRGNQFVGSIPEGLSNCVNLAELALENNLLSGSIHLSIGKLIELQHLNLTNNMISGSIPISIGNLTRLFALELDYNNLTGAIPSSFKKLQGLQILRLSHNALSGSIPKLIGSFSRLVSADFAHNTFTGPLPSEIGSNAILDLNFSNNKFSGEIPSAFGNCMELESLHLENNLLQGSIPSSFGSLKGIVELDLSNNNLSGAIPEQLEKLSFLKSLNLSFNGLQGEVPSQGIFKNATAISIVGNKNLCGGIPELYLSACTAKESNKLRNHLSLVAIIATASAVAGLFLMGILAFIWWKRKSRNASSRKPIEKEFLRVSYSDLLKATDGFSSSNLIGVGSFGSVYKGILHPDERPAAVKVFNIEKVGATESFIAECEALRKTRHRNLVKIITACSSVNFQGDNFKALVFEFMANGSLESWLHPCENMSLQRQKNLNVSRRLNIAIDIAFALAYLHQDCESPIVHCDLKPGNILLDEDMNARVGDFGLARFLALSFSSGSIVSGQSVAVRGTIGYVAPEYGMGREVSTQGDIYSYGILLLEMVTGKKPTDDMFTERRSLRSCCRMALEEQSLEIVDPRLLLDESIQGVNPRHMKAKKMECLLSLLKLGVECSAANPDDRTDAGSVLMELNGIKKRFLDKKFVRREQFSCE